MTRRGEGKLQMREVTRWRNSDVRARKTKRQVEEGEKRERTANESGTLSLLW